MNNCKLWCCGSRRFTETSRTPMDWIKPMCRQRGYAGPIPCRPWASRDGDPRHIELPSLSPFAIGNQAPRLDSTLGHRTGDRSKFD